MESGGKGVGDGRRGGGDNINYLVKIITEDKVFLCLLRNWMFCLLMYVRYLFPLFWQSLSLILK